MPMKLQYELGSRCQTPTTSFLLVATIILQFQLLFKSCVSLQAPIVSNTIKVRSNPSFASVRSLDISVQAQSPSSDVDTDNALYTRPIKNSAHFYAAYWENLLQIEHQQNVEDLKLRRKTWSKSRLEASGMSIFHASAEPDSELYGEKIVKVYRKMAGSRSNKGNVNTWRDKFTRGDLLVMTPTPAASFFGGKRSFERRLKAPTVVPKECLVIDVGVDWLTLGVGRTWPMGLWEVRKDPGAFVVRLDRTAAQAPLKAQRIALERLRKGQAGDVARSMANLFYTTHDVDRTGGGDDTPQDQAFKDAVDLTSQLPPRFSSVLQEFESDSLTSQSISNDRSQLEIEIRNAIDASSKGIKFQPDESQIDAIAWALQRQISLIRGPPGTGKTRVASLLIKTALKLKHKHETLENDGDEDKDDRKRNMLNLPRVLAVTHSNGAADVLLEALLQMRVPAIRLGRPASVSPRVQHRTVVAITEKMPELIKFRQRISDTSLDRHERSAASFEMKQYMIDIQKTILATAPVVVTSCIGANQLLLDINTEDGNGNVSSEGRHFPIVVLDEAAQTTEPALLCALSSAQCEQLILVGDTKQLPPTITSVELRGSLGVSPMARLEKFVDEITLRHCYRMPKSLLDYPSQYFYNGKVTCAETKTPAPPPTGFKWPTVDPLAYINIGNDSESTHNFGGKSNPTEVQMVVKIASGLLEVGEVGAENIAVISPYSKQVQLIRTELSNLSRTYKEAHNIRVGTVDSFQGYETDVVIFSAVRSNQLNDLGFLRDQRRLCVAITRARKGLIIIGDRKVLRTCRHWAALLDHCTDRGCTLNESDFIYEEEEKTLEEVNENIDIIEDSTLENLIDAHDGLDHLFNW